MINSTYKESRHVPAAYCRNLIDQVCAEERIDAAAFFAGTDIDRDHLYAGAESQDTDTTTHSNQIKVYERVAELSTQPGFGFRAGVATDFGAQGLLGALLYTAPSIAVAFEKLEQYIDVIGGMLRYWVDDTGPELLLSCSVNGSVSPAAQVLVTEESIAIWKHLSLPVGGLDAFTRQIRIDYPQPTHAQQYSELLPAMDFVFDHSRLQIVLAKSVLDLPMPGANPAAFTLLESQCATIKARIKPALVQRLRDHLAATPPAAWTQTAITERLHCSSRTLRRHLQAEGTSLREVVDRHRADLALRALKRGDSITQIAASCGFGSTDSFSRAFKRWHGQAPTRLFRHGH